jgi:hypothetical protein
MKFPKPLKITSRTSTITNAFVQAIIPFSQPDVEELLESLRFLGMTKESISCCYCGDKASDWDHLRPLVKDKKPTGFISDYRNLVPCCAPCNQSKSGSHWRNWICSSAKKSPLSRKIVDLDKRITTLEKFEIWGQVAALRIEELADPETLKQYWLSLELIKTKMKDAQIIAQAIKLEVLHSLKKQAQIQPFLRGEKNHRGEE